MISLKRIALLFLCLFLICSFTSCSKADKDYGVSSEEMSSVNKKNESVKIGDDATIVSLDRVMSNYFDISLFDEENYADIYLGKKFKIQATYNDVVFEVPTKLDELAKKGWVLAEGNSYDKNSLVFSLETVFALFKDKNGNIIEAQFFNSSKSSVTLSDCNIVKFSFYNDFYEETSNYNLFNVNGITNSMAITDIIHTLGTPSHFYPVSDTCYYLDYFITEKDRRNGITIYINPVDDIITKIEFSYYK